MTDTHGMFQISPTTPDVALPIAEYIAANYPPASEWPRETLLRWVRWNLGENFLRYILDGGG